MDTATLAMLTLLVSVLLLLSVFGLEQRLRRKREKHAH